MILLFFFFGYPLLLIVLKRTPGLLEEIILELGLVFFSNIFHFFESLEIFSSEAL